MRHLDSTELKRLHRGWRRRATHRVALALDSVQTPYNVGAVLRSAAAFRVEDVWRIGSTPPPDGTKVQKTAMGSDRFVTDHEVEDPAAAAAEIAAAGYRLVAVELTERAVPIHDADLGGDCCLAVGHEDRGLSAAMVDAADQVVYIPQLGRIGSLNVATATSIALYEVRRQDWS